MILTVLNVCSSIGWIIFSHSYLHVTHDKISVCLAIWLIWWTNIFVIKMINTPGHVLSPGWPLCKRSGLTLIEVSQHAYSSYQASSLPFIFYHVILATWCNWLDFYWCWIKFCLSLSLSLNVKYEMFIFAHPIIHYGTQWNVPLSQHNYHITANYQFPVWVWPGPNKRMLIVVSLGNTGDIMECMKNHLNAWYICHIVPFYLEVSFWHNIYRSIPTVRSFLC